MVRREGGSSGLWLIVTSVENVSFCKKFEDAHELKEKGKVVQREGGRGL